MRNSIKLLLSALLGTVLALALGEGVARWMVPPASRAILEPGRVVSVKLDPHTEGLPRQVRWHANSLGLRGPELPADSSVMRILCVGGSTTECTLLNDGQTWPDQLAARLTQLGHNVWVGNAGRDGLSTYGQLELLPGLLQQVQPDVVILLNGPNDMGRSAPNRHDLDLGLPPELHPSPLGKLARTLAQHSALVRGVVLALRSLRQSDSYARAHRLRFDPTVRSVHPVNAKAILDSLRAHKPFVDGYVQRMDSLRAMIRAAGAVPVTLTHPVLAGPNGDASRDFDGMTMAATEHHNGYTYWAILDAYNRAVCEGKLLPDMFETPPVVIGSDSTETVISITARRRDCIDLAGNWIMRSGYYDLMHLNRIGAQQQAEVIAQHLTRLLTEQELQRNQQQKRTKYALHGQR